MPFQNKVKLRILAFGQTHPNKSDILKSLFAFQRLQSSRQSRNANLFLRNSAEKFQSRLQDTFATEVTEVTDDNL